MKILYRHKWHKSLELSEIAIVYCLNIAASKGMGNVIPISVSIVALGGMLLSLWRTWHS